MLHKNCKNKMVARSLNFSSQKSKCIYFLTTCVVRFGLSSYAKTMSLRWYFSNTLFRDAARQIN